AGHPSRSGDRAGRRKHVPLSRRDLLSGSHRGGPAGRPSGPQQRSLRDRHLQVWGDGKRGRRSLRSCLCGSGNQPSAPDSGSDPNGAGAAEDPMNASAPGAAARQTRPVAAALFMLASVACFAMNSILVRYVSEEIHPFEIAFFRNLFAASIIVPIALYHNGIGILRARRFDLLTGRGLVNASSMIAWFYAVPLIPLADLTVLGFTAPLWATVL